jgi:hypothetical protein
VDTCGTGFERPTEITISSQDLKPSPWIRTPDQSLGFAPILLERDAKATDQIRSGEGLGQEASCPRLQRSGASSVVGEGRDEYERRAMTLGAHHRQELQSAHARHLQIRDHARRVIQAARLQEVLGGRICLDRVPVRPQKLAGRRTNRRIIVDDRNN